MERDSKGRFIKGCKGTRTPENSLPRVSPIYENKESLFYIMGVLYGDGYITNYKRNYHIGLAVKSLIFAKSFAGALTELGLNIWLGKLKFGKREYYRVNSYSKSLYQFRQNFSLDMVPKRYMRAFIRGFYESEGHDRGRGRGLLLFNTDKSLLGTIKVFLNELGIASAYSTPGKTPNGKTIVYRLYIPSKFKSAFIDKIKPVIKIDMVAGEDSWHSKDCPNYRTKEIDYLRHSPKKADSTSKRKNA